MFVERFMAWSDSASVDQRATEISGLAVRFLNEPMLHDDRQEVEKVLTLYLEDSSSKVRQALAKVIARHDKAPRHLVWGLSQDIVDVAAPIFQYSTLMRSRDLINAVLQDQCAVQCAIASRVELDGDIIRSIVENAGAQAVRVLLENPCVVLGPGLKHDIAQRYGDDADIRTILLDDAMLDASTRQLLVQRLSGSLLDLVSSTGWADIASLQKVANEASNRVTVEIAMQTTPERMEEYIEHLKQSNQLTPALLIRACCMGHAALFEHALSVLSGASLKRVQSIVDEGRMSAFKSLYGRTGLPQSAYPVFLAAIEAWQEPRALPELIGQILSKVENDGRVDGALSSMLGRMACEANREAAQDYQRQLRLAA